MDETLRDIVHRTGKLMFYNPQKLQLIRGAQAVFANNIHTL